MTEPTTQAERLTRIETLIEAGLKNARRTGNGQDRTGGVQEQGCWLSGGAANLIRADPFGTSVAITAPGYFTSAGASGTSGAGIYVTGITS